MGYGQLIGAAVGQARNIYAQGRTNQMYGRAAKKRNEGWVYAMAEYRKWLDRALGDLEPYLESGKVNLEEMMKLFDDPSSVRDTPGYDFRMKEGEKSLERGAAARGGLYSGRQMKELDRYGQDYGAKEYTEAINRRLSLGDYLAQFDAMNNQTIMKGGENLANLYIGQGNARALGIENKINDGKYWTATMNNKSTEIGEGIGSVWGGGGIGKGGGKSGGKGGGGGGGGGGGIDLSSIMSMFGGGGGGGGGGGSSFGGG